MLINEPDGENLKDAFQRLYDMRYQVFIAANTIVNYHYSLYHELRALIKGKEKEEANEIVRARLDTSVENHTYQMLTRDFPILPSIVRSSLNRKIYTAFKNNLGDVLRGRRTLATYRMGMPIPFQITATLRKQTINEKEEIVYPLQRDLSFILLFGNDKSNNRHIVNEIMADKYKLCDSQLEIDTERNKIYLLLSVQIPVESIKADPAKVAATNLGMNCPMYITSTIGAHSPIGSKDEFLGVRIQMQRRRRDMQANMVTVRAGHGRERKLKGLEHLQEVEKNFARTFNHKLSKALMKFCRANGIGTIKTEDLLGGAKTLEKSFVLRNWSYFELQSQIEYKAKMYGIKVVKVQTKHITQKCHKCGTVDPDAVNLDNRTYTCSNADCEIYNKRLNVDYNASMNVLLAEPAPKQAAEEVPVSA